MSLKLQLLLNSSKYSIHHSFYTFFFLLKNKYKYKYKYKYTIHNHYHWSFLYLKKLPTTFFIIIVIMGEILIWHELWYKNTDHNDSEDFLYTFHVVF